METTKTSRRTLAAAVPRSPRLHRTASGESALSLPESRSTRRSPSPQQPITRPSRSATSSPRPSIERSRSTIKLRTTTTTTRGKEVKRDESELQYPTKKLLPSINSPKIPNTSSSSDELTRLSTRRPSPHSMAMRRVSSTLTGSPSAWALSPGRTLAPLPPSSPSSPSPSLISSPSLERSTSKERSSSSSSSSLSSSVWRYFQRQKRASPEEEEGFHQYRIMYNRLLQWRLANAKSEASMRVIKKKGEEKLFAVWVKVCKMRNSIAEKRSRVQRLRLKIKLLGIVCPQLYLLDEWEVLEKRNSEAVARVARKLSAFSTKLPLVNGARVDIIDLYEAMRSAMEALQDIEIHITKFLSQAEDTCNILTEVIRTMGEHDKSFQELEKSIAAIMFLEAEEKSLRANLIQANKEVWESQNSCKYHRFISFSNSGRIFNPLYSTRTQCFLISHLAN